MGFLMRLCILFFSVIFPIFGLAGVMPEKSRIVFDAKNTTQSYMLANTNNYPVFVQLWVDDGEFNQSPESTSSPFIITPVILKIDSLKLNEIKVIFSGDSDKINKNQESLFWLNILEIPPKKNESSSYNDIALSMLTQIKLIYRPENLKIGENELIDKLEEINFTITKGSNGYFELKINNPTNYVASLAEINLLDNENNRKIGIKSGESSSLTLLPKSNEVIHTNLSSNSGSFSSIGYFLIDDEGKFIYRMKKLIKI
ncbi:fimbria/pilus periplasmic chaperone [Providencia alcalifaciens]|nr:fimbria/pilus periplasmic chaperone [Providencia alcalifaciens]